MLYALKSALAASVFLLAVSSSQFCSGQDEGTKVVDANASFVTNQTGSRRNYALLKPIGTQKPNRVSFATKPQMLEPLQNIRTDANEDGIVVVPSAFKRNIFDQHEFLIRNEGSKTLANATVMFFAPIGSTVQQVVPKPEMVAGQRVEVAVNNLAPGQERTIEIAINYPRNELARFESKIKNLQWANSPVTKANPIAYQDTQKTDAFSLPGVGMLQPKVKAIAVSASGSQVITRTQSVRNEMPNEPAILKPKVAPSNILKPLVNEVELLGNSLPVEPEDVADSSPAKEPVTTTPNTIKAKLKGPESVAVGAEEEYSIDLHNISIDAVDELVVQLSIPANLKVTVLDRAAWYDSDNRKLTWKIESLEMGAVETIRYKALVKEKCSVEQAMTTGVDGTFGGKSTLLTTAK